jgi:hypothetical protein
MNYTINIKRLSDGKVFTIKKVWENDSIANLCFHWTDGNGGCDCNRSLETGGNLNGSEGTCGDMKMYIAWIEVNGQIVMDERPLDPDSPRDLAVLYYGAPG